MPDSRPFASGMVLSLVLGCAVIGVVCGDDGHQFFERSVRPILVERCLDCHSHALETTEGGLALDSASGWQRGGGRGPAIVPGNRSASLILRAVRRESSDLAMPPDDRLSEAEINVLADWIKMGAHDPRQGEPRIAGMTTKQARRWWSFQPIPQSVTIARRSRHGVRPRFGTHRSPIDAFIDRRLDELQLTPLPLADRRTLIRRASWDLTGLPPSYDQVQAFIDDPSPTAFADLVDRLLASPQYGERWGRHWLDLMRYADYLNPQGPGSRAGSVVEIYEAWKYRDWVIQSFNNDVAYNDFLHDQVAGDLRPARPDGSPDPEGQIATTWMAIGAWDNGDADKDKVVADIVDDQINVIGQSFLGITLACARCHDHKFDPITIDDYYALAGIFYSTRVLSSLGAKGAHTEFLHTPLAPSAYVTKRNAQWTELQELEQRIEEREHAVQVAAAASTGTAGKGPKVTKLAAPSVNPEPLPNEQLSELMELRDQLKAELVPAPPTALGAQEGGTPGSLFPSIQNVQIHRRGKHTDLGREVPRGLPKFLAGAADAPVTSGSGRRELAQWLATADHPLVVRVIVNRIWQWHFGRAIVNTPSNFGKLGELPSHPDLLDYLAREFIRSGWSIKHLHRRIMLSVAYQRASVTDQTDHTKRLLDRDPNNVYLARFSPRRLQAEEIRDSIMQAADSLSSTMGGAADVDMFSPRRTLYVQSTRYRREYFTSLFDAADNEQPTAQRSLSTVAPQALFFMNHPWIKQHAHRIGTGIAQQSSSDDRRLRVLFERLLQRHPSDAEIVFARRVLGASGRSPVSADWASLAHLLIASNEFLFVD